MIHEGWDRKEVGDGVYYSSWILNSKKPWAVVTITKGKRDEGWRIEAVFPADRNSKKIFHHRTLKQAMRLAGILRGVLRAYERAEHLMVVALEEHEKSAG